MKYDYCYYFSQYTPYPRCNVMTHTVNCFVTVSSEIY